MTTQTVQTNTATVAKNRMEILKAAPLKAPANSVTPKYLAHLVFRTSNYPEMLAFYKKLLRATPAYENDFISFLSYDEEHHRIAIIKTPNLKPNEDSIAGMHHFSFGYESLGHLADAYIRRKEMGITPVWCVNHGPTTSMYYKDPDGNMSEHQVDNFDSIEETTAFMQSSYFSENPIGTDFDPEEFVARVKSNESPVSIKRRNEIGERTSI